MGFGTRARGHATVTKNANCRFTQATSVARLPRAATPDQPAPTHPDPAPSGPASILGHPRSRRLLDIDTVVGTIRRGVADRVCPHPLAFLGARQPGPFPGRRRDPDAHVAPRRGLDAHDRWLKATRGLLHIFTTNRVR